MSFPRRSRAVAAYCYLGVASGSAFADALLTYVATLFLFDLVRGGTLTAAYVGINALVTVGVSHFTARAVDKIRPRQQLLVSMSVRSGMVAVFLVMARLNFDAEAFWVYLFLIAVAYRLLWRIDQQIHAPIPFRLRSEGTVDVAQFRAIATFLVRGFNVVAPGIAIWLYDQGWQRATSTLAILVAVSVAGPAIARSILSEAAQARNRPDDRAQDLDKRLVFFAAFLQLSLNLSFANLAIILAKYARDHSLTVAGVITPQSSFFAALLVCMIGLATLSRVRGHLKDSVVRKILLSTLVLSLLYSAVPFSNSLGLVTLLFAMGLLYGINVTLVTTSLPAKLGLDRIATKLNAITIAATVGVVGSMAWIGFLVDRGAESLTVVGIMGLAGLVATACGAVLARRLEIWKL